MLTGLCRALRYSRVLLRQRVIGYPAWYTTHDASNKPSGASPNSVRVEAPDYLDERERVVFNSLSQSLRPSKLEVQDISGGCGSMYAIDVVSEQFAGLPVVKQHRLVNQILKDEIKTWHGVQLKTRAPT
ncbi:bola-like protein [Piedraia hortae CBS 480.64]|uniref:Bola-like protein n=1 Tax=Piedraia hortae CBS 480.64 TaxID=1314780 RepID=A0A6A7C461_9PEZI|nr:bola-like protein [Piedraia hortae CBS 480.64]